MFPAGLSSRVPSLSKRYVSLSSKEANPSSEYSPLLNLSLRECQNLKYFHSYFLLQDAYNTSPFVYPYQHYLKELFLSSWWGFIFVPSNGFSFIYDKLKYFVVISRNVWSWRRVKAGSPIFLF